MAWLAETIADGPFPSAEVWRLAEEEGISPKSLRTARERLCKKPTRDGFGEASRTMWALRHPSASAPEGAIDQGMEEAS
jgi:hypothetical protein